MILLTLLCFLCVKCIASRQSVNYDLQSNEIRILQVHEYYLTENASENEKNALRDLYNSTNGDKWIWLNESSVNGMIWDFNNASFPCIGLWQGISCSLSKVEVLNLPAYNLNGSLPSSIGNLTGLVSLYLQHNLLSNTIPSTVCTMRNLTTLSLYYNLLEGPLLPCITQMEALSTILLFYNNLTGTIPFDIGRMSGLNTFAVYENPLHGSIPDSVCQCSQLSRFSAYSNSLTGSIPDCIGNLSNLAVLELNDNLLTNSLPESFSNLTSLYWFIVSNNSFTGSLPNGIYHFSELFLLVLTSNLFSHTISSDLSGLTSLQIFYMDNNTFSGSVPDVTSAPLLTAYFTAYNALTGSIELSAVSTSTLQYYAVDQNQLTGVASVTMELPDLIYLALDYNFLTGTLDSENWALRNVTEFRVNNNFFEGSVSKNIGSLRELTVLFMQENLFSGPLENVVTDLQLVLSDIDFSHNQFTGLIPSEPFTLPRLQSFAAVSNCLSGPLPVVICTAPSLVALVLDGVGTASSCQNRFFGDWTNIRSYSTTLRISGGILNCLLSMDKLQTLHLSGNSITGTIPSGNVSQMLTELCLSHNFLTGSIPLTIQTHNWTNLDLSYNKLQGTLLSQYPPIADTSYLTLSVNRLSGNIPTEVEAAVGVNILDGNMFACNLQRTDLPKHDRSKETYECGSNSFVASIAIWAVSALLVAGMFVFRQFWSENSMQRPRLFSWESFGSGPVESNSNKLDLFLQFIHLIRMMMLGVTLFLLLFILPSYVGLNYSYSTITHQYAWITSCAYLHGIVPGVVILLICLICMGVLTAFFWLYNSNCYNDNNNERLTKLETFSWNIRSQFAAILLVDVVVMIAVNVGYVTVADQFSTSVVEVTQATVALFKLVWNKIIIRTFLERTKKIACRSNNADIDSSSEHRPIISVAVDVFIVLFNNIAAPMISFAFVSTNCFYDVFRTPSAVDVTVSFRTCLQLDPSLATNCLSYVMLDKTVSYDPPFTYMYQCSSSFLSTYASIYVYMFVFLGVGTPLLNLCGWWLLQKKWIKNNTLLTALVSAVVPKLLSLTDGDSKLIVTTGRDSVVHTNCYDIVFEVDMFVVQLLGAIAVIGTVGVVMPPVAVVGFISLCLLAQFTRSLMIRFITLVTESTSTSNVSHLLIAQLHRDVIGTELLFMDAMWVVAPFAAVFYACFLFDIVGDSVGWFRALWAPLLVVGCPSLVWLGLVSQRYQKRRLAEGSTDEKRTSEVVVNPVTNNNLEMNGMVF